MKTRREGYKTLHRATAFDLPLLDVGDVTDAARLLEITARMSRVLGFEFDVASGCMTWLKQTLNIFDEAEEAIPSATRLADVLSHAAYARELEQLHTTARTGERTEDEFDAVTAKGAPLRIHVVREAMSVDGRVTKVYGAIRDITQEPNRSAATRVANEGLKAAIDIAGVRMWETDPELDQFYFTTDPVAPGDTLPTRSPRAIEIYASKLMAADDLARMKDVLKSVLDSGDPASGRWRVTRPGFGVRWLEQRIRRSVGDDGRPILCGASRDVTEEVAAQETLFRVSADAAGALGRFEALVSATSGLIYEASADWTTLRHLNLTTHAVRPAREPTTRWLETYVHPDDRALVTQTVEAAIRGKGVFDLEHRVLRADGGVGWTHSRAIPLLGPGGEIEAWFGLAYSITERKKLEGALQNALVDANAANNAKSSFIANMSHEIRTPMSTVIGMLEVLLRTPLNENQRDHASIALKSSRDLLHILNDVLDTSAIEAGKVSIQIQPFSIRALLAEKAAMFRLRAEQKALSLTVASAEGVPEWQLSDERRIRQVLGNLIGNSLKYTETGGITIAASFDAASNLLRIEVADTGIGIDEDAQRTLFQPFSQADATLSRKYAGSGLGLSISRKLVELMGGRIGVSSKLGKGSVFWCEIPAPACEAPDDSNPEEPSDVAIPPLSVLVAEDNAAAQRIIQALLGAMGHSVKIVDNGAAAVAEAASGRYDVVLMDVMMPEMDGPTASMKIRELGGRAGGVPIIALTADIMFSKDGKHLLAGMTDYVSKPIDLALLAAALRRASLAGHEVARGV